MVDDGTFDSSEKGFVEAKNGWGDGEINSSMSVTLSLLCQLNIRVERLSQNVNIRLWRPGKRSSLAIKIQIP